MVERTIGIIGAMRSEMDAIKDSVRDAGIRRISGIDFVEGRIEGVRVVVAACGPGKVFAGMCTQTMILNYNPDLMINVGVAGSLTPDLNIGDIAVASCVVQYDVDTTGAGDPIGLISNINIVEFPCDEETVRRLSVSAEDLGFHHVEGMIATGDQFIKSGDRKKKILENFPAISCEMEGAAMGQVCYVNSVPFCVLRAISDNGDENATVDYDISLEMAADRATRVLINYLKASV